ncbi:MAG: PAS domain-containing protein [Myxococcaceae bacterium]|nr:PAS domain-containing protein [Myxococcaceae bacterium]
MAFDFSRSFEWAPVAMVVLDRELRVLGANRRYLELTGSTPESLVGRELLAAFPNDPDDPNDASRQLLEASLKKVLRTGQPDHLAHIRYRVARRAGEPPELRIWSATHVPLFDSAGEVEAVLQHTEDVTQLEDTSALHLLQRAEAVQREVSTLDRELEEVRAMVAQAPGFMAFLSGPDHVFTLVNDAYTRLVGGRDVLDKPLRDALPDVVAQGYPELLDRVVQSGEPFFGHGHRVELVDKNGTPYTRLIDFIYQPIRGADGAVAGVLVQGHDLTEHAWAIERDRFRARVAQQLVQGGDDVTGVLAHVAHDAAASISDWAIIDLFENGKSRRLAIAHRNPGDAGLAEQLRAWPLPFEIPSTHVLHGQAASPRVVSDVTPEMLRGVSRSEEHLELLEHMAIRSVLSVPLLLRGTLYGVLVLLNSRASRRFDENDIVPMAELGAVLATGLDNARLLRDANQAREAAEAASRAKDDFLAMLGHELRNPLAPILTAVQLLRMKGDGAHQRQHEVIERQARHLTRLVDDMLDVSAVVHGKLEVRKKPVGLKGIIDKAVEIAGPQVRERQHTLSVVVADGLVVDGDEARLSQVVVNLLTNAARYTPPGGHIWVDARSSESSVKVTVRDDGVGIAKEVLPTVFEMFVQAPQSADRPQGGLGLGLTLVRRIVALHGGTSGITSDGPGKGTTATVVLPAHASPPRVERKASPAAGAGQRVLIVDDNDDAAALLSELLSELGHETQVASDGAAALALLADHKVDVAVIDIGLPGMSGLELAQTLRARLGSDAPRMVALTGFGTQDDRERCLAAGFAEHLTKPVDAEQLIRSVAGATGVAPASRPG